MPYVFDHTQTFPRQWPRFVYLNFLYYRKSINKQLTNERPKGPDSIQFEMSEGHKVRLFPESNLRHLEININTHHL